MSNISSCYFGSTVLLFGTQRATIKIFSVTLSLGETAHYRELNDFVMSRGGSAEGTSQIDTMI